MAWDERFVFESCRPSPPGGLGDMGLNIFDFGFLNPATWFSSDASDAFKQASAETETRRASLRPTSAPAPANNAYGEVVTATNSAREQADLANYVEADRALTKARNSVNQVGGPARGQAEALFAQTFGYVAASRQRTALEVAEAKKRFDARVTAAQAEAGRESVRALEIQRKCNEEWWNPANWVDPSCKTGAAVKWDFAKIALVVGGVYIVGKFVTGLGQGLGNRGT